MTRRNCTLVLLSAALLGALASAPVLARDTRELDLHKVSRIVTLGDSITQGGARPGGYVWLIDHYLQVLYPGHKIEVINAGISGHKSTDMLARYQRDVLDKKPDVVTISVGINDVWHGFNAEHPAGYGPNRVKLEDYRKNVEAMLDAADKAGIRVVMFTTTIFEDKPNSIRNLRVQGYNDTLRELAAKHHALLADQYGAFMTAWHANEASGAKLTSDQVHMAPAGDELMARTALLALGIPAHKLDAARAEVMKQIGK